MQMYKFILTLPNGFEIDSEYDVEGHVAWPNYSQADPIRYKGVFDSYDEAKDYVSDFEVYKYVLKYYYGSPYDSFEDEDEYPKYFVSIFDAEDAACAELGIDPGDMITPPEYEIERITREDAEGSVGADAYKYRLVHNGECVLDSFDELGECFDTDWMAEEAAIRAARENQVEIDELPYELLPIEIERTQIVEVDD